MIREIAMNSRMVSSGDVFVCIAGSVTNGHAYIDEAVARGAAAIVIDKTQVDECRIALRGRRATVVAVEDTRYALAMMAAAFYGYPAKELQIIGITGTKGKTSATYMVKAILEEAGHKVGLIGTVESIIGDETIPAGNTTPESLMIQRQLRRMCEVGCDFAVMEVSSQGLKLHRTAGIYFKAGVFTNFGKDHIGPNEHESLEEYAACKSLLFQQCEITVGNVDDAAYEKICGGASGQKFTYGINNPADVMAENIKFVKEPGALGVLYTVSAGKKFTLGVHIPGLFSVYNSLAAITVCRLFAVTIQDVRRAFEKVQVKGRIEMIPVSNRFTVMIDYAHNAMSLESVLKTLREYGPKRLVVIFGCGGNRARGRRFEMGEAAGKLADFTIITSDNPRNEEPQEIINDIISGMEKTAGKYTSICDRKEAVRYALTRAEDGDIIVLAGKGHESYQEIQGVKYDLDERQLIREIAGEEKIS